MAKLKILWVFIWKNWLHFRNNCVLYVLMIGACALLISTYLASTKHLLDIPEFIHEPKTIDILRSTFPLNDVLFYTPKTPQIDAFMDDVRIALEKGEATLKALGNDTNLQYHLEHDCKTDCFGISFIDFPQHETAGSRLLYELSATPMRISPKKRYVNDEDINTVKEDDDYTRAGFLTLQHIIDRTYKEKFAPNALNTEIEISAMPTVAIDAMEGRRILTFGSIYSVLFSVLLLSTFLVPLVEEKQDGIKEFLVIATPLHYLNGVAFFIIRFVIYAAYMMLALAVAYNCQGLGHVPMYYSLTLFTLYTLSAMFYAYLISVCFHSVFYSKVGGLVLFIIPFVFYMVRGGLSDMATYCFSTKAFMEGLEVFQVFTNKHRVLTFGDHFINITDMSYQMFSIYAILIVQCFAYALLYNYLSCVLPGPTGIRKDCAFFLRASFYKKKQHRNEYTTGEKGADAIIIQDLVKSFHTSRKDIIIADKLNMAIKNKHITVLLGHNGVGKTTILRMIMGSEPKDSGKITVLSERDVCSYRHLIGFCPQHSAFMSYMTCRQHLSFFAQLRGMCKTDADRLTESLLQQLKLTEKANEYGRNLSGGMKRRLSLGIALAGETKVVILDEPSSGLDIESRRELWDVLLELRKRKAILITTHHMEEAEVLGDTISILSKGCLQRSGSPLELKRKVGTGYILKLIVEPRAGVRATALDVIREYVPTASAMTAVLPTQLISLPYADKPQYAAMLRELEAKQGDLGIHSMSITDTSLDDVFLNCAANVDQIDGGTQTRNYNEICVPYKPLDAPGHIRWWQRFGAIYYKKALFLRSEWAYTVIMLLLPFASIALAMLLMRASGALEVGGQLPLNLQHIRNGTIYIHYPTDPESPKSDQLADILHKEVHKYPNIRAQYLNLTSTNDNMTAELLNQQRANLGDFWQNIICAIDILKPSSSDDRDDPLQVHLYYSSNVHHSSAILMNLIDNAILASGAHIDTTYVPVRRFVADISPTRLEYYAIIVPIGLFFYMFFYVMLPFKEHQTNFKDLQAVPTGLYWCTVFSFDALLHLLLCILLGLWQALLIRLMGASDSYAQHEQCVIVWSFFIYGCSYMPILYLLANALRSISTIATYLLFMLIVSAIMPLITSSNMQAMQLHETKIMVLSLLPDFNLNHQLRVINENFIARRNKAKFESLSEDSFFVYAILTFALTMTFFVFVLEDKRRRQSLTEFFTLRACRRANGNKSTIQPADDLECGAVETDADSATSAADVLRVEHLSKYYKDKAVVDDLNFTVARKECFGLLGVNGAGKTTTFQMLTANVPLSSGSVSIDGTDLRTQLLPYRMKYGYCPQNDCINDYMTAWQMLKYMGRLRGLPGAKLDDEVAHWLTALNLIKYTHIRIRHYSGGTKRKLNMAIAMIGSPALVLLDEPTTGVDPAARRFLWKTIQCSLDDDKTVVLTSHSMDECEHLCNRLAIMANGKFRCVGSVAELKQSHDAGFTVKIKLIDTYTDDDVTDVGNEMLKHFPDNILRENHAGMLTYFVKTRTAWSAVFEHMEAVKCEFMALFVDYSINESTLEDIILKFDTANGKAGQEQYTEKIADEVGRLLPKHSSG